MQIIFRAPYEHEWEAERARRFDRGGDPLHGVREIVDRPLRIPARVFDGSAHEPRDFARKPDRFCGGFRGVSETILEIRGNGRLVASAIAFAFAIVSSRVTSPVPSRLPSEYAKPALVVVSASNPHALEDPRGAGVPRIRNDERAGARVQRGKAFALHFLCVTPGHRTPPIR